MYRREVALAFLPLIFLPASYPCGSCRPPFFSAFHALAVDDSSSRAGFPPSLFATLLIKRVVNSAPMCLYSLQIEIFVDRAFRRQVFRDRAPLTAS